MKTFLTICISCSLALGLTVMAQEPDAQQSPKKEKKEAGEGRSQQAAGGRAQAQAPGQHEHAGAKANAGVKGEAAEHANNAQPGNAGKAENARHGHAEHAAAATSPAAAEQGAGEHKNQRGANNKAAAKQASHAAATEASPAGHKQASPAASAAAATAPSPAAGAAQAKSRNPAANKTVDVQKIKAQHTNFHAQAKPEQVPAVTFNQNYRITNAERWQGPQYEVYRSYHPEWHDAGWYRSRYHRVELIGGGYYFFNNGYWYPAWGYDPGAQYYAYDAPIYVGRQAEPPDKVIADVQAVLQEQGYYRGEVDGLLGPLTREALTGYQSDHGLYATAVIDEPTLDSLGMG